ncbi:MAG: carboxylating nicotinate-nucleotide diphosphorylase [Magnetospiraceae bacterium]
MNLVPMLPALLEPPVRLALAEDLGRAGDITTGAVISADAQATAHIAARATGVVAGLDLVATTFRQIDPSVALTISIPDGETAPAGATIATLRGAARSVLSGERVALNFLGHLSGIATATRSFVDLIQGTGARITCTRKTTPGLRALEKYAVRCGGGINHRFGLDDAVLIKDNHIVAAGGITQAIQRARQSTGHMVKIETEVDTLDQLEEALAAGTDVVLLDNMPPDVLRQAVQRIDGAAIAEASGGITLETVRAVAETGVDVISVGWLTHSAPNLDLGLDFEG